MSKTIKKILSLLLVAFYLCVGVLTIIIAVAPNIDKTPQMCGLLVVLSSIVHIFLYFINEGYKNKEKGFFLVIGIVAFSLGLIFMLSGIEIPGKEEEVQALGIAEICLYWGILDIVRSSLEIKDIIPELKENKLNFLELAISIGDIVLGILLCIERGNGIALHLIYLGSAFILTAMKILVQIIIVKKKDKTNAE